MKILPTIGPVSEKAQDLKFLFKYCSIIRLNSSHNNINWHKKIIKKIKKINLTIDILIDIPGVKPRTDNKENIKLKKGELISFGYKTKNQKNKIIDLTRKLPKKRGEDNHYFSLDDGKIFFKIVKFNKKILTGVALDDCIIKPRKGLNIPNSVYDDKIQKKNLH